MPLVKRLVAELSGTAMLLAAVIGSGIMGERLSSGNVAVALLANTLATGAALVALILTFGPISGAHFNPAVTVADASQGGLPWREVPLYLGAQIAGAFVGVAAGDAMFDEPVFALSRHARTGPSQCHTTTDPRCRDATHCRVSRTRSTVIMPPSAWERMWQWAIQSPGLSAWSRKRTAAYIGTLTVSSSV